MVIKRYTNNKPVKHKRRIEMLLVEWKDGTENCSCFITWDSAYSLTSILDKANIEYKVILTDTGVCLDPN